MIVCSSGLEKASGYLVKVPALGQSRLILHKEFVPNGSEHLFSERYWTVSDYHTGTSVLVVDEYQPDPKSATRFTLEKIAAFGILAYLKLVDTYPKINIGDPGASTANTDLLRSACLPVGTS